MRCVDRDSEACRISRRVPSMRLRLINSHIVARQATRRTLISWSVVAPDRQYPHPSVERLASTSTFRLPQDMHEDKWGGGVLAVPQCWWADSPPPRPSKNVPSLYLLRQLALLELDSPTLLHIRVQLSLAASHALRFITNVIPISHQSARFIAFSI